MRTRPLALLLVLSVVVALATVIQDFRFDVSLARARAAALAIDRDFASIDASLASWRAAQAGYVATGQNPAPWIKQAAERSGEIEAAIVRLQATTLSPDARAQYDAATSALGDLNGLDGRARDFALSDRRFEAADLVFSDAVSSVQRLTDALAGARVVEQRAAEARLVQTRWLRLGMNTLAVICLIGAAVLMHRNSARVELDLENLRIASLTPPIQDGVVSAARPASVNLTAAAELCVDLGRVMNGRDVPALFERLAPLLGAKGVVLWIADASGAVLRPSLTLGYSDRVVERLGVLPADGDNVTSLAFRSMRSQMVNGTAPASLGAIAVPLVTPGGCVGVLAAEVSRTRPDVDTVAVARMIAAQFAGLVAPAEPSLPEVRTAH